MPDDTARHALGDPPGASRRPSGALEAEVLAVLRAAGTPLSPGQVRERLAASGQRELSYSTVVTIVSRLYAKGLLARERAGRGFAYTPLDRGQPGGRRDEPGAGRRRGPPRGAEQVRVGPVRPGRAAAAPLLTGDGQDQDGG